MKKKGIDHNHDKYITTGEFNKVAAEKFDARSKKAHLVIKTEFIGELKNFDQKINSNKTKHFLVENEKLTNI